MPEDPEPAGVSRRRRVRVLLAAVVSAGAALVVVASLVSAGPGSTANSEDRTAFVQHVGVVCANATARLERMGKVAGGASARDDARSAVAGAEIATSEARELAAIRPPTSAAEAYHAWVDGFEAGARWLRQYATALAAHDSPSLMKLSAHGPSVSATAQLSEQRAAGLGAVCQGTFANPTYKITVTPAP